MLILNKKNFLTLELKKFNKENNSFFKNNYCSKILNYVKLTRSLTEMEESRKFQSSTFDTVARRRLFWNFLAGYRKWKMKEIAWMILRMFSMQNQFAVEIPTLPVDQCHSTSSNTCRDVETFFRIAEPQRRAAKHLGHSWLSGNVFANQVTFSSAPYPQELNQWSSSIEERLHSQDQDQRCQSGPSAKNSVIILWETIFKELRGRPTMTADFRSSFRQLAGR